MFLLSGSSDMGCKPRSYWLLPLVNYLKTPFFECFCKQTCKHVPLLKIVGTYQNQRKYMYIPPQFEEVRESEILKIIENFPLAVLVCNNDGDLIANHIPLFRHSPSTYLGHIAKANQLHNIFPNGANALAIFFQRTPTYLLIGIQQRLTLIVMFQLGIIKLCIWKEGYLSITQINRNSE